MDARFFDDLTNESGYVPEKPIAVPGARKPELWDPARYLPDSGLADAIKVALLLRKPLLLTGEPGTGKTELAYYLTWKLGHKDVQGNPDKPLLFEAKSNSTARDLFYTYDTLARFEDYQTGRGKETQHYLHFNALGEALIQANAHEGVKGLLTERFAHRGPRQSVVLIDEIDKAPRDFPNDILNEIDKAYFRVRELDHREVRAPRGMEPIIVITSNSEKNLPGPFLRRCVYYHIEFREDRLRAIVAARIKEFRKEDGRPAASPALDGALQLMGKLRSKEVGLHNRPATAELLDWLMAMLAEGLDVKRPLRDQKALAVATSLVTLLKDERDQLGQRTAMASYL